MKSEYTFSAQIKNQIINFRKWKVKDKKLFLQNKDNPIELKNALVYNCLEDKDIVLCLDEYKFLLLKIRNASLKEEIKYTFSCESCNSEFDWVADLDEIMTPVFSDKNTIVCGDHNFELQRIKNKSFFENSIVDLTESEAELMEFIFHIKSYNDNDTLSFEDINEIIDNTDIDIFTDVIKQWKEIKFKVDNTHSVTCPNCEKSKVYEFDSLPNFFPESWDI